MNRLRILFLGVTSSLMMVALASPATFTAEQVQRFAPEVRFHAAERFFPVSALSLAFEPGRPHPFVPAPMYVSVEPCADASCIDLRFVMLYAYNGPQTLRTARGYDDFNLLASGLGEHAGDVETVTVRVTPDLESVLSVRFDAHGRGRRFGREQVAFVNDPVTGRPTHPIVRAALHSHAMYNAMERSHQDWVMQHQVAGVLSAVDLVGSDDGGARWQPWESATDSRVQFVGEDWIQLHEQRVGRPRNDVYDYWAIGLGADGSLQPLGCDEMTYLTALDLETGGARRLAKEMGQGRTATPPQVASR
jgi:hypothetical protein